MPGLHPALREVLSEALAVRPARARASRSNSTPRYPTHLVRKRDHSHHKREPSWQKDWNFVTAREHTFATQSRLTVMGLVQQDGSVQNRTMRV